MLIAVGLVVTVYVHFQPSHTSLISILEYPLRDTVLRTLSGRSPPSEIVLVDIDELSIRERGGWPWSRSDLATLASLIISNLNAKIIAFDIVLPQPRDKSGDRNLLRMAEERKLVLSQVFDYVKRPMPIATGTLAMGSSTEAGSNSVGIPATGIIGNHLGLSSAPCVGNIGFIPDNDGKLRRVIHLTQFESRVFSSLSLELITCLGVVRQPIVEASSNLRFDRTPDSWIVIQARDVFRIPLDLELAIALKTIFEQKIVIVGSSALGLSDRIATPLSSSTSGMFVHAQALSEMMDAKTDRQAPISAPLSTLLHLAVVFFVGIALVKIEKQLALWISLLAIFTLWAILVVWQIKAGSHLNQSASVWAFLIFAFILSPYEWVSARRKIRYVSSLLERYVSTKILSQVMSIEDLSVLSPKTAEITVLVVDMVSYSQTVSSQPLEVAAQMTRDYIAEITEPIWQCEGTIDRYTGDGLIAFWGAPIFQKNHAELALHAAELIQARIDKLNETSLRPQARPEISVRIGVASGVAIVGDFGTNRRANYTAVGTCINMAARLEATAKDLDTNILVSESTARLVEFHNLRHIERIDIRGIGLTNVFTLGSLPVSQKVIPVRL